MSLVNLAHVCSHLQNASRARLGVTSVIFTKLHLSVMLVLQQHGFIAQVKVAGPTPPLSFFPAAARQELQRKTFNANRSAGQELEQAASTAPEDILSDAELDFLLAHYQKSRPELDTFISGESSSPLDFTAGLQKPRILDIVDRHRRLVFEAKRLVEAGDSEKASLQQLVSRVLQPSEDGDLLPSSEKSDVEDVDQEGVITQANRASRRLWLEMKYWNGQPVLKGASLVSLPKKRLTLKLPDIEKITHGRTSNTVRPLNRIGEILILKTAEGVLESRQCLEKHVGGQALCRMW